MNKANILLLADRLERGDCPVLDHEYIGFNNADFAPEAATDLTGHGRKMSGDVLCWAVILMGKDPRGVDWSEAGEFFGLDYGQIEQISHGTWDIADNVRMLRNLAETGDVVFSRT